MKTLGMAWVLGCAVVFGGCAVNSADSNETGSASQGDAVETRGTTLPPVPTDPTHFELTGTWVPDSESGSKDEFAIFPDGSCIFAGADCTISVEKYSPRPDYQTPWTVTFQMKSEPTTAIVWTIIVVEDDHLVMVEGDSEEDRYTGFKRASVNTASFAATESATTEAGIVDSK